ncbi:MAG: hypothetical protein AAF363_17220 [Bacteroidota bacterium]
MKLDWILIILTILTCIGITSASSASNDDLLNKGKAYIDNHDYEMAKQCFDRIIEANPKNVSAYIERSNLWALMGNCEKSMNDLLEASVINAQAAEDYLESSNLKESDIKSCFRSFR